MQKQSVAEMAATQRTAETGPLPKEKDHHKQMIITKDLLQHIEEFFAIDIELDKEARRYFKCLCKQRHLIWTQK